MLLRSILDGILKVPLIIIEDNVECSGVPLMLQLINKLSARKIIFKILYEPFFNQYYDPREKTDIFCLDMNTELFNKSASENSVTYHPIYKHCAVNTKSLESNDNNYCLHGEIDLFEMFKRSCLTESERGGSILVIDSLSLLLFKNGLVNTVKTLNKFLDFSCNVNKHFQLICFLHSDVHQERVIKAIEFLSQVVIKLNCAENNFTETAILHKKSKGVLNELSYFKISEQSIHIFEEKHFPRKLMRSEPLKIEESTLSSKLTFNLSLNEAEKESRAKVILPYEKQNVTAGGGNISYEYERDDDFDEDDPDDDLDI